MLNKDSRIDEFEKMYFSGCNEDWDEAQKLLIKYLDDGLDVNAIGINVVRDRTSSKYPPLYLAIDNNDYELIKTLINYGADVNIKFNFQDRDKNCKEDMNAIELSEYLSSIDLIDGNISNYLRTIYDKNVLTEDLKPVEEIKPKRTMKL